MQKASVLLLALFLIVALAEDVKKTKYDTDLRKLAEAAAVAGAYALDQTIEHRWTIYKKITGNEIPTTFQKAQVEDAERFLKDTLADAAIGMTVRRFWLPATISAAALAVILYFRSTLMAKKQK
jgi:hypothetical protein